MTKHSGQEFDLVIKGSLKIQVGEHVETLREGDSIFYKSSIPHGMIAVDGEDCLFLAMVMAEDEALADNHMSTVNTGKSTVEEKLICDKFITTTVDENGVCDSIKFNDEDKFNFAFDLVDALAELSLKWDFDIIDLWNNPAMRAVSDDDYKKYMKDPVHPNRLGYIEWWGPEFKKALTNI